MKAIFGHSNLLQIWQVFLKLLSEGKVVPFIKVLHFKTCLTQMTYWGQKEGRLQIVKESSTKDWKIKNSQN
jgi:hypothetical protein